MAKEVYIEKERSVNKTIRKVGKDVKETTDPKDIVTFISTKRDLLLFKKEDYIIKFDNHYYKTDNKSDIAFLKSHPRYEQDFWKDKFPDYVLKKMKEDQKWIEVDEDAFVPAE